MEKPLVSIIIPTFNRAHLIAETLDSILAQTYTNWECIIVDDGSSDATAEVVNKYVKIDSRFQYHHRPNTYKSGGNGARNYGFKLSKGEYVSWFDSDDIMFRDRIFIFINTALQNKSVVLISNREEQEIENYERFIQDDKTLSIQNFDYDYILKRYSILTGDVLFKREVVENLKFDENLFKAQEFDFFMRAFSKILTYSFIQESLWIHRDFPDSISKKTSQSNFSKARSLIYLSKKIQSAYTNNHDIINEARRLGKKQYKSLMKNKKYGLVLHNFIFFKKCFDRNIFTFSFFFIYNLITKKGFDVIKK